MKSVRNPTQILVLLAIAVTTVPAVARAGEGSAAQRLDHAIDLYQSRDYTGARDVLGEIPETELSTADRQRLQQYRTAVDVAVEQAQRAASTLDQVRAAAAASDDGLVKKLVGQILANEYAAPEVRNDALAEMSRLARAERRSLRLAGAQDDFVWESTSPRPSSQAQRADNLIQQGIDAMQRGDNQAAQNYFNQALQLVPGHPDAVNALEQLRMHRTVESTGPDQIRLIDRMRHRRAVLWERAVAAYRQAEQEIQEFVSQDRFQQANQKLLFARETIESARQYASPLSDYESLKAQYQALADTVAAREQAYNEQRAFEIRRDLEQRESERQTAVDTERQRQVNLLMEQVEQLQEDRDFKGAIQVLRQVKVIDPQNMEADWLLAELEDLSSVDRQNTARERMNRETRKLLIEADEAKVPWAEDLNYPENWLEIKRSPYRGVPGEYPLDSGEADLEQAFRERIPEISFNQTQLQDALRQLADASGTNIVPNWHDLAVGGIARDTPVTLHLHDVPVRSVLNEVIEQAESAGSAPIDFAVREGGIVKVATRDYLDREVFTRVYYVSDLIQPPEDFGDGPEFDLRKKYRQRQRSDPAFASNDRGDDAEEQRAGNSKNEHMDELVQMIEQHVQPEKLALPQGGSHATIHARSDGNLVVTQTARGHQEIFNLLNQLREDNAVQIIIEARFLTVNHNFLEDIGIDLNIVLNNGNAGFDAGFVNGAQAFDPASGGRLLLPRNFSRLGFLPAPAPFGTTLANQVTPDQPYGTPGMVPVQTGGSNLWSPIPINSGVGAFTDPRNLLSDVPGSFAGGEFNPALQIAGSFLDNIQVDFLIRATQADSRTNTLIAPKLVMTNGQQAWIAITEQQNYVSELDPVVASGAAAQRPITDSLDTGAVLNVQAVVSPDKRYVTMNLQPGVGRLVAINTFQFSGGPITGVGAPGFVQLPIIQRQQVKTTATVPDGGTLLIGGQKLTFEQEIESGVPVLSKIPVLKRLYSSRATIKDEQVLLILIKPLILIREEQEEKDFPTMGSM